MCPSITWSEAAVSVPLEAFVSLQHARQRVSCLLQPRYQQKRLEGVLNMGGQRKRYWSLWLLENALWIGGMILCTVRTCWCAIVGSR